MSKQDIGWLGSRLPDFWETISIYMYCMLSLQSTQPSIGICPILTSYQIQFNQSPIQTGHLDSVKGDHFTEMKIAVLNWKKFETLTTDCWIQSESLIRCCLLQAPLIQQLSQMLNRSDCLMEVKITVLKVGEFWDFNNWPLNMVLLNRFECITFQQEFFFYTTVNNKDHLLEALL